MVEDNIYPRDKVLEHLEKISSDLAIEYLEYIIHELGDTTPEFHNKLILAYLQKLKAMPRSTTGKAFHTRNDLSNLGTLYLSGQIIFLW